MSNLQRLATSKRLRCSSFATSRGPAVLPACGKANLWTWADRRCMSDEPGEANAAIMKLRRMKRDVCRYIQTDRPRPVASWSPRSEFEALLTA